jgi:hypothetical protein
MEILTPDKLAEIKEKLDKKLNYEKGSKKEVEYTRKTRCNRYKNKTNKKRRKSCRRYRHR